MVDTSKSRHIQWLSIHLFHDLGDAIFDQHVLAEPHIKKNCALLTIAALHFKKSSLHGITLFFYLIISFLELVEGCDEGFSIVHNDLVLIHQGLVFLMECMVIHLQVRELSGAITKSSFKQRQIPFCHHSSFGHI